MFECLTYIPDMSRQDSERHLLAAAALQSPGDKHQPCAQAVAPPDTPEAEVLKEVIFVAVRACAPKMISTLKKQLIFWPESSAAVKSMLGRCWNECANARDYLCLACRHAEPGWL